MPSSDPVSAQRPSTAVPSSQEQLPSVPTPSPLPPNASTITQTHTDLSWWDGLDDVFDRIIDWICTYLLCGLCGTRQTRQPAPASPSSAATSQQNIAPFAPSLEGPTPTLTATTTPLATTLPHHATKQEVVKEDLQPRSPATHASQTPLPAEAPATITEPEISNVSPFNIKTVKVTDSSGQRLPQMSIEIDQKLIRDSRNQIHTWPPCEKITLRPADPLSHNDWNSKHKIYELKITFSKERPLIYFIDMSPTERESDSLKALEWSPVVFSSIHLPDDFKIHNRDRKLSLTTSDVEGMLRKFSWHSPKYKFIEIVLLHERLAYCSILYEGKTWMFWAFPDASGFGEGGLHPFPAEHIQDADNTHSTFIVYGMKIRFQVGGYDGRLTIESVNGKSKASWDRWARLSDESIKVERVELPGR